LVLLLLKLFVEQLSAKRSMRNRGVHECATVDGFSVLTALLLASFHPNLMMCGDKKVVTMVTTHVMGSKIELVAPTSAPPFAATRDISPAVEESPTDVLIDVAGL
jgi:hypothetical protein